MCPTFFFDVRCGAKTYRDERGSEAASDAEAVHHAAASVKEFLDEHHALGESVDIDEIIIRDELGKDVAHIDIRALGQR